MKIVIRIENQEFEPTSEVVERLDEFYQFLLQTNRAENWSFGEYLVGILKTEAEMTVELQRDLEIEDLEIG